MSNEKEGALTEVFRAN